MKKKSLNILLAVMMIVGMMPLSVISAFAEGGTEPDGTAGLPKLTHEHAYTWNNELGANGIHTLVCSNADGLCEGLTKTEKCTYENGFCTVCGAGEPLWKTPDSANKYIVRNWDDIHKKVVSTELDIPTTAQEITAATTELDCGWYIVRGTFTNGNRIVIKGTAGNPTNIILLDDAVLNAAEGIEVIEGSGLTIYGQKNETGKITARGRLFNAGIGSSTEGNGGTITINGGTVTAESIFGAGIGGKTGSSGGAVTINGGTVTATSDKGAGIGGGMNGNGGYITINGGTVTASSNEGAGIGGGKNGTDHSYLYIHDSLSIMAGDDADTAEPVSAIRYKAKRNRYVSITAPHDQDITGDGDPDDPSAGYDIIAGANSEWTKGEAVGLLITSDAPFARFENVKVDGTTIAPANYTAEEGSTKITLVPAYLETLSVGSHSMEIVSNDGSASTFFTVKTTEQPPVPAAYTVAFNMGGHGTAPADQMINEGGKAVKPADPICEGWTFGGWYADAAFSTPFDFSTLITANTTIYAKWTKSSAPQTDPVGPQTGDNHPMILWIALLLVSGSALFGAAVYGKRKS